MRIWYVGSAKPRVAGAFRESGPALVIWRWRRGEPIFHELSKEEPSRRFGLVSGKRCPDRSKKFVKRSTGERSRCLDDFLDSAPKVFDREGSRLGHVPILIAGQA